MGLVPIDVDFSKQKLDTYQVGWEIDRCDLIYYLPTQVYTHTFVHTYIYTYAWYKNSPGSSTRCGRAGGSEVHLRSRWVGRMCNKFTNKKAKWWLLLVRTSWPKRAGKFEEMQRRGVGCKEMGEMTTVKYQSLLHLGKRRIRESLTAGWKRRGELPSLSTNELCKSS